MRAAITEPRRLNCQPGFCARGSQARTSGARSHADVLFVARLGVRQHREAEMLFSGGFTFSNFLADVLSIFVFVLWFWLLITVCGDLFRRQDVSGWVKSIW